MVLEVHALMQHADDVDSVLEFAKKDHVCARRKHTIAAADVIILASPFGLRGNEFDGTNAIA
jgi:hypothetical protein